MLRQLLLCSDLCRPRKIQWILQAMPPAPLTIQPAADKAFKPFQRRRKIAE